MPSRDAPATEISKFVWDRFDASKYTRFRLTGQLTWIQFTFPEAVNFREGLPLVSFDDQRQIKLPHHLERVAPPDLQGWAGGGVPIGRVR